MDVIFEKNVMFKCYTSMKTYFSGIVCSTYLFMLVSDELEAKCSVLIPLIEAVACSASIPVIKVVQLAESTWLYL